MESRVETIEKGLEEVWGKITKEGSELLETLVRDKGVGGSRDRIGDSASSQADRAEETERLSAGINDWTQIG
ncbi:hypothetical protein OROHE_004696 [Orobanche hederae]